MINTSKPDDHLEEEALSKIGKWLTIGQIKTLECAFVNFPENYDRSSIYANFCEAGNREVFSFSVVHDSDSNNNLSFKF